MDDFNLDGIIKNVGEGSSFDKFITSIKKVSTFISKINEKDFDTIKSASNLDIKEIKISILDENNIHIIWKNFNFKIIKKYDNTLMFELETDDINGVDVPNEIELVNIIKSELRNNILNKII